MDLWKGAALGAAIVMLAACYSPLGNPAVSQQSSRNWVKQSWASMPVEAAIAQCNYEVPVMVQQSMQRGDGPLMEMAYRNKAAAACMAAKGYQ
ncbi:hypothetical protein E6C67_08160 [Azospirillum sp. TSA2s]|uniref:hypothetical protein n=1 Tax=Azospirillum sp. TSA2s TaxID=709810 RepID=UPI0010A99676|nr:hypothetical protein [Azospirillum sp. TSA2s]QCG93914.1 hypothetical protein E6C67_08160 [Azospirillum sp. TSA2s]